MPNPLVLAFLLIFGGRSDSSARVLEVRETDLEFFKHHLCLNKVEIKERSSALVIGFRSWHGGAILGSFCLFFSYPRLFFVHDKMSIIKSSLHSRAS